MRILGDLLTPSCWSVRTRVTVAATLLVAVLLVVGVTLFYQVLRGTIYRGLHDRGTLVVGDLALMSRETDPRGTIPVEDPGFPLLQILDGQGDVLAASESLRGHGPVKVPVSPRAGRPEYHVLHWPGPSDVYFVSERVETRFGERIVFAGAPITTFTRYRGVFVGLLAVTVLVATSVVGWIVSLSVRRALRPVRVMRTELAEITGGADRRVTVPEPNDEMSDLAESVNVTLDRLEDVLTRQRAFVADVSHELRSPLTGLRTQLEAALERPEEDEDWPAVARAALADADRLQGIVSDLLILARLGAGVQVPRERVDLGELVRTEVGRRPWRVPAEVAAEEGVAVRATRAHLVRLLTNLLDNAERHAESRIRVTVAADGPDAVLEVRDDGAGIAPEDRERIFWRFHRLAEGRERDRGGTGLGLTISRDIARAHGGTLVAADSDRGARFVLRIPRAES